MLVVFDVIGTTVVDDGLITRALVDTLCSVGVEVNSSQLAEVRGRSKRDAIAHLLGRGSTADDDARSIYTTFQGRVADALARRGASAMPGAESLFGQLRADGIRVALTTGLGGEMTRLLLGSLGWTAHGVVDAIISGDDVAQGRPAPYLIFHAMEAVGAVSPRHVACVGDTASDLHAGQHAGARWNIGVLSGAHDRQMLEAAPHTHIVASIADVRSTWG
jgi:phosphonatase-like hydrolase